MAGLGALLRTLSQALPPWLLVPVVAALMIWFIPAWLENMRQKQVRGLVRRMVRAEEPDRQALAQQALEMSAGNATRLAIVVEQCVKYDQRTLREQALAALDVVDRTRAEQLRAADRPAQQKNVLHPIEVAVNVERLLSEGMVEIARARLAEGLARHPADPDLLALQARIEATRA